jgi:hypothetical protein
MAAEIEASRIFHEAGITVSWLNCPVSNPELSPVQLLANPHGIIAHHNCRNFVKRWGPPQISTLGATLMLVRISGGLFSVLMLQEFSSSRLLHRSWNYDEDVVNRKKVPIQGATWLVWSIYFTSTTSLPFSL